MRPEERPSVSSGIITGVIVIAVGVILLLDRSGVLYARDLFRFWPAILIAFGIAKLLEPSIPERRIWGAILVLVGSALLSNSLGYTDIRFADVWPVLIIAVGVLLVWRSIDGRPPGSRAACGRRFGGATPAEAPAPGEDWTSRSSSGWVNDWATFGGVERKIDTQEFEGGQLVAVFGGTEIDLRRAALKNGKAVIEATAVFGGIEIRVPETWEVVLRGTGIFGGYSDHTHPVPDPAMRTGTLWVRGVALFGGVEVKN